MTRRTLKRLRWMGALSGLVLAGLVAAILYFAIGSNWQRRTIAAATPATPHVIARIVATATPAPSVTPTSRWEAGSATSTPQPTSTPTQSVSIASDYTTRSTTNDAHVRFVHASIDAPAMDIYINGIKSFSAQPYQSITPYFSLPAGTYLVQAVKAGLAPMAGNTLIQAALNALAKHDYSIVAANHLSNLTPIILNDDNTLPDYGDVRVRVAHVAAGRGEFSTRLTTTTVITGALGYLKTSPYAIAKAHAMNVSARLSPALQVSRQIENTRVRMGTVYTLWLFEPRANGVADVAVSEDAYQPYLLLPETGGELDRRFVETIGKKSSHTNLLTCGHERQTDQDHYYEGFEPHK